MQRSFTFNAENKQIHVKDANNAPVGTYYYDGNGNRVKKATATETTIFVYDGSGKMVAEYSTQQSANPTVSYLTTDHLGTPRVITDKNGNVISRRDFLPFGEEIGVNTAQTVGRSSNPQYNSGDNVRQKFTGYERDNETNLDFADARYYDGKFGRFTAVDPLLASGKSTDPQTFNRYTYALNTPLLMVDSTGEKPVYVSGKKGHQKFTDYYVKGSTRYEGGRQRIFGTINGIKGYYIVRRDGIFSENSKAKLRNSNSSNSESQATKPKAKPSQSNNEVPEVNKEIFQQVHEKAVHQGKIIAVGEIGAGVIGGCIALCGPIAAALGITGTSEYVATHPNETSRVIQTATIEAQTLLANSDRTRNIALGVSEHLDEFAEKVGGSTWSTWGSGNFQRQFLETINNTSNRISFNLTGIDNPWSAISQGARGIEGGVTNWELYTIYSNPEVLQRTTFYLNGVVVANPFK